mgnify:CR=1 FL=1
MKIKYKRYDTPKSFSGIKNPFGQNPMIVYAPYIPIIKLRDDHLYKKWSCLLNDDNYTKKVIHCDEPFNPGKP